MIPPPDEPPAIPELGRLPRDAEVSELSEERTVQALRARRLLGPRARRRPAAAFRVALQLAAALALFAGGLALGERLGRTATPPPGAPTAADNAALAVQQAGTSFVRAIANVTTMDGSRDPRVIADAHAAARSTLRAAQALLDPNRQRDSARGGPQVIWF